MANLNPHLRVELPKEWIEVSSCDKGGRMNISWRVCSHGFGTWRSFLKKRLLWALQFSEYSYQMAESRLLHRIICEHPKRIRPEYYEFRWNLQESISRNIVEHRPCRTYILLANSITPKTHERENCIIIITNTPLKRNRLVCFHALLHQIVQWRKTGYIRYVKGDLRPSRTFAAIRKINRQ